MKILNKHIFLLLMLASSISIYSCKNKKEKKEAQTVLSFDMKDAKQVNFSHIADSIRFIKLVTPEVNLRN